MIETGFIWIGQVQIMDLWKYDNETLDKLIYLLLY